MTILEIKDKLVNDEINYSEALEQIKKLPKPWHTKEWTIKREKIIKTECEQCNSTEGIMVAQHLTHPEDFKTIRNRLFNELFNENIQSTTLEKPLVTEKDIAEFHDRTTKIREACPHCKWIRIRKRKKMRPEYFCEICMVDFDIPTSIKYNQVFKTVFPTDEQVADYLHYKMEEEILQKFKNELYTKVEKQIGKEAVLFSIELHLKYIELETVVTFCKRCATKMDLEYKLLCWNCKTDYFDYLLYDSCYKCYSKNEIKKSPIKEMILQAWKDKKN